MKRSSLKEVVDTAFDPKTIEKDRNDVSKDKEGTVEYAPIPEESLVELDQLSDSVPSDNEEDETPKTIIV